MRKLACLIPTVSLSFPDIYVAQKVVVQNDHFGTAYARVRFLLLRMAASTSVLTFRYIGFSVRTGGRHVALGRVVMIWIFEDEVL